MTRDKGPSILWTEFQRVVPNGTWVRQLAEGSIVINLTFPLEGILTLNNVDDLHAPTVHGEKILRVTVMNAVDEVLLKAGEVEYKIGGAWIDFHELCIRATEQRLAEAGVSVDADPLQWMTHASELNMSVTQIGTMLYEAAAWIESKGNRGYRAEDLMIALPAFKARVLKNAYKMAWENILFFGEGGSKREFSGWGVHKRTPAHWSVTWFDRFGADETLAAMYWGTLWDEALVEHETRSVKRAHETYMGVDLEKAETIEIAHKAAALWLVSTWARQRSWRHGDTREIWLMQATLCHEASAVFAHELLYRLDRQPKRRRSKAVTQAVREDWATASRYLAVREGFVRHVGLDPHTFYTAAYVTACCETDTAPDTAIDVKALPRDVEAHEVTEGASEREAQR